MADSRDDEEILMNMIYDGDEQVRYDDRECDENPQGIDDGFQYLALEGILEDNAGHLFRKGASDPHWPVLPFCG